MAKRGTRELQAKGSALSPDRHKVWLIAGITLAVVFVLILAFGDTLENFTYHNQKGY